MAYIYVRHSYFSRVVEYSAMKQIAAVIMAGIMAGISGAVHAGDVAAGKVRSATCTGCHGEQGVSSNPLWPNLAGQQQAYLVKQLQDFREGTRSDPMMGPISEPLSDTEIQNLAAYFSSL
jgi:cytochrome c553